MKLFPWCAGLLLVMPGTASAQAAGAAGRGSDGRGGESAENIPSALSSKKIQQFDAVKVILDKKGDLKLDDKQRSELSRLESQVQWNLRRLTARIDTAQKRLRPDGGADNDARDLSRSRGGGGRRGMGAGGVVIDEVNESMEARRERIRLARRILADAIADLRIEYDSSSARSLRVLNDTQRPAAAALLKQRDAELLKILTDAGLIPKS